MNTLVNKQIEKVKISNNKGLSWNEIEIDIKQLDPEKTTLKAGDWIQRNGIMYEIKLSEHEKMKGLLQASSIVEYTVANRSFDKYEEAVQYCNSCDLDLELNLQVN